MNLAIVSDLSAPGGVSRIVAEETKGLLKLGHEVKLIFLMKSSDSWSILEDVPTTYPFSLPLKLPFSIANEVLSAMLSSILPLPRIGKLILSHEFPSTFSAFLTWKKFRIPYIAFIYEPLYYTLRNPMIGLPFTKIQNFRRKIATKLLSHAEVVVTLSKFNSKRILELYSFDSELLYPGCRPIKTLPKRRDNFVLMVERLFPWRLFPQMIEIMSQVKGGKLVIAGSRTPTTPNVLHTINRLAKKFNLKDKVTVIISPSEGQLTRLYMRSKAYIHPCIEPFNMTALEAAAHGCPIVVAKNSGITEIVKHGVHGLIAEEGDIETFAEYLGKLLCDAELACKLGRNAWERAKRYDWDHHMDSLCNILTRINI